MEDIGTQIRRLRRRRKMTQGELSERSEISTSYLSKIERGLRTPTVPILTRISRAMDVDLSSFDIGLPTTKSDAIQEINHMLHASEPKDVLWVASVVRRLLDHP
tara:strand:- start:61 stop:372 length:312 start_codon:yes stop_codon:yes gene_type:complete